MKMSLRKKISNSKLLWALLAAGLVSSCSAGSFSTACPAIVEYSREDQLEMDAVLMDETTPDIVGEWITDYGALRDQTRICQGQQ